MAALKVVPVEAIDPLSPEKESLILSIKPDPREEAISLSIPDTAFFRASRSSSTGLATFIFETDDAAFWAALSALSAAASTSLAALSAEAPISCAAVSVRDATSACARAVSLSTSSSSLL